MTPAAPVLELDEEAVDALVGCTACDENRCHEMFTCLICGRELHACTHRAGGLDSEQQECDWCWETKNLDPGWDAELAKKVQRPRIDYYRREVDKLARCKGPASWRVLAYMTPEEVSLICDPTA